MGTKIIAVGNRIMKDDGVAIHIIEQIEDELKDKGLTVIIGETDVEACLDEIHEEDFIILIDSSYFDIEPGNITKVPLENLKLDYKKGISQHDFNLLDALRRINKKISGYFIGIEIGEIDFGLELSDELKEKYPLIVNKIRFYINEMLEG